MRQTQGTLQPDREGSKQEKFKTYIGHKMQADCINLRKSEIIIPVRKKGKGGMILEEQVHTKWDVRKCSFLLMRWERRVLA